MEHTIDQAPSHGTQANNNPVVVGSLVNENIILDTIVTNSTLSAGPTDNQPLFEAGCVWDAINYSCACDAVFMAFFSMYRRSSLLWQECW